MLDLRTLSGILDYDPGEYTFTALAGTPITEVDRPLAEHGQYLPFDPPLAERGATLGGTVAAGLSGAGRVRFGGVRDFLIGVRFVDGQGRLVRGGGKVVKNAAGFDLPKLMVGSLGSLGVLVEITFKVFPRPEARRTLQVRCANLDAGLEAVSRIRSGFDPEAADLEAGGTLWLRLAGRQNALDELTDRACELFGDLGIVDEACDDWWAEGAGLLRERRCGVALRVPVTPNRIARLDAALDRRCERRYVAGAQLAWVGWPDSRPCAELDRLLAEQSLTGLSVLGEAPVFLGRSPDGVVASRLKAVLDPNSKFPALLPGTP